MRAPLAFLALALVPRPAAAQEDMTAVLVAQGFVVALLSGDTATAVGLAAAPFSFDGEVAGDAAALREAIERLVSSGRLRSRRLLRVRALSSREAIRRFGDPPERIRSLVGPRDLVVLARLNRGGIALLLRKVGPFWRVIGVTD